MRFAESGNGARCSPQISVVDALGCSGPPVTFPAQNPPERLFHRSLKSPAVYLLADTALSIYHAPPPLVSVTAVYHPASMLVCWKAVAEAVLCGQTIDEYEPDGASAKEFAALADAIGALPL